MTVLSLLRKDPNKPWLATEIAERLRMRLVDVYEQLVSLEAEGLAILSMRCHAGRSLGLWEAM